MGGGPRDYQNRTVAAFRLVTTPIPERWPPLGAGGSGLPSPGGPGEGRGGEGPTYLLVRLLCPITMVR
jgi:hypothetical protein